MSAGLFGRGEVHLRCTLNGSHTVHQRKIWWTSTKDGRMSGILTWTSDTNEKPKLTNKEKA